MLTPRSLGAVSPVLSAFRTSHKEEEQVIFTLSWIKGQNVLPSRKLIMCIIYWEKYQIRVFQSLWWVMIMCLYLYWMYKPCLSFSQTLPEVCLDWIYWIPKLPRFHGSCAGWWHSGWLLWHQQKDHRTKTGLDKEIIWRRTSALEDVHSAVCRGDCNLLQHHYGQFKEAIQPKWR